MSLQTANCADLNYKYKVIFVDCPGFAVVFEWEDFYRFSCRFFDLYMQNACLKQLYGF